HRSVAEILHDRGFETLDVRDCGLRGKNDDEIFRFAQKEKAIILTGDLGFGNILKFPVGTYPGIVVAHFPSQMPTHEINKELENAFNDLEEKDLKGNLV
ncbi:hypothetical protein GWN91_07430, partial [Candidatus Saccharibacteria bacterium]|nr:hypothetical protein [Candidatus Saccharibacteria bacterium]NIV72937.1 hypothetical protein [Calditrichia bacterium]NIW80528.1 hypothetical protein [Calditrichia bacterium]